MENAYLNNETQISGCEQANITSSALYMLPYSEFSTFINDKKITSNYWIFTLFFLKFKKNSKLIGALA